LVIEPNNLRIGTSSFTANGWRGTFYPPGTKPADYLSFYATKFDAVEVDSTFYGTPSVSTVKAWNAKTPPGFVFAAKVPQVITHEKVLVDCDAEFNEFIKVMDNLDDKLGPFLLQFGFFNTTVFPGVNDFLGRLRPFLKKIPTDHKFAVEIRNKKWLVPQFVEALREHGIALALTDQSWMPRPAQWFEKFDPITADFTYVRWLGDRKDIEAKTEVWNKLVVDRSAELTEWANVLRKLKVQVYVYANNHYAGYSPATVEMFRNLWRKQVGQVVPEISMTRRAAEQGLLFE
jgi:uncharacterized protein YecE (DUF72 family)